MLFNVETKISSHLPAKNNMLQLQRICKISFHKTHNTYLEFWESSQTMSTQRYNKLILQKYLEVADVKDQNELSFNA